MNLTFSFFFNSILIGIGLAMDAFSVSLANGLNEPKMKKGRLCLFALVFACFQFIMPMLGWLFVHTASEMFVGFQKFIPYIAFVLLLFIGGKMLIEGIKGEDDDFKPHKTGLYALLVQGVATSIDALSVGFTISNYNILEALVCCLLIGTVTFIICAIGLAIGKCCGTKLASSAGIFGGAILIFIGLEIFISSFF